MASTLTVQLRNGYEVAAKLYAGEACAKTYANRTQANAALAAMPANEGWAVYRFAGRPWYVGRQITTNKES